MKTYDGPTGPARIIKSQPMTRAEYNEYRGLDIQEGSQTSPAGHLVEFADGRKPNDSRHTGYIGWLADDEFQRQFGDSPEAA